MMDHDIPDPGSSGRLCLFALGASRPLGEAIGRALDRPLARQEERTFADGEHKTRPLVNVRNRDVFVVHSLAQDAEQTVNDKLCRLLFFAGGLKDASAASVTAVVPYLCYARKDRKTKEQDPLTFQYVARMFEAVGVNRIVTCDVHNLAAYQNAFRCRTEHLTAAEVLISPVDAAIEQRAVVVVSPDTGGLKRARAFRDMFERISDRNATLAVMEKSRNEGEVTGDELFGEVESRTAVIVDDLISTGTTMARAVDACRERGAREVFAAATHGLLSAGGHRLLRHAGLTRLFVTNTVVPPADDRPSATEKLTVVDTGPLFAGAIRRIQDEDNLSESRGD